MIKIKPLKKSTINDTTLVSLAIAVMLFVINIYLVKNTRAHALINMVAGAVALTVPLVTRYIYHIQSKSIEHNFPDFLRDITSNIKAGMTLTQAIRMCKNKNYGYLTPYVNEMSAKIDWGISFEKVLETFANTVQNHVISRAVKTIIETHRSGGNISEVLDAVVSSVTEIEKIKKERSTRIYSQMINGYVIYFVFLGVMIGMSKFLIPAFNWGGTKATAGTFTSVFRGIILIQSVFAGLTIGKLAEGSLTDGFKHAFIMFLFGYATILIMG